MLASQAIFAGYILVLSETVHSGSTPEGRVIKQVKQAFCLTNTPLVSVLLLRLDRPK